MFSFRPLCSLLCLIGLYQPIVQADTITLPHQGLNLSAELALANDTPVQGHDLIIITHGTLAHNKMELIATLQDLFQDAGVNSLAINLSLGVDQRQGMYDCQVPHQHQHTDALDEIGQWVDWAQQQQASRIILLGHSRGGNQTAWFNTHAKSQISAQILIAPATWSAEQDPQSDPSLNSVLAQAEQAPDQWLTDTNFLYCPGSKVLGRAFSSYYAPNPKLDTPYLLTRTTLPTLVISGSEDTVVSDLPQKMAAIHNTHVQHQIIEGADHFFRDLYTDEVLEHITAFMDQLP